MSRWSLPDGDILSLLTKEQFDETPDGTPLRSILGENLVKGVDDIDDDTRFGYMAVGPVVAHIDSKPEPGEGYQVWTCKIGGKGLNIPPGGDFPMREAVERALKEMTGEYSLFNFSGWGGSLTESELAVIERRTES